MKPFWTRFAIIIAATFPAIGAIGQAAYSPGQTFTAGQPAPAAHPTPTQYIYQQQAPAVPRSAQPRPLVATPMYNMAATPRPRAASEAMQNKPRIQVEKKTDEKPVVSKSQSGSASNSKKSILPATELEQEAKPTEKVEAVDKIEAKAEPVGAPESTDKLVFFSRRTGKKQIALTYDDGPNPSYTKKLTEYLKANNVPATFFLCGNMVKEYPETVRQLADDGFELANHSYDHPSLNKISREKVQSQLQDTHDLIKEASGIDVKLMRPPYGAKNKTVEEVCDVMGYKIIQWDIDTEDWKKRSASYMINLIMKKASDGSIILMHDRKHGGNDTVLETTRQVVEKLRAQGYTFVTVGELIGQSDIPARIASPAIDEVVTTPAIVQSPLPTPMPVLP